MYHVFISYSRKNKDVAHRIHDILVNACNMNVFIDKKGIGITNDYTKNLQRAISQSDLFLLIYSRAVEDSIEVRDELNWARRERKAIVIFKIEDIENDSNFNYKLHQTQQFASKNLNPACVSDDDIELIISPICEYFNIKRVKKDDSKSKEPVIIMKKIDEGSRARFIDNELYVVTRSFSMSQYPITQRQYELVMGENPSVHKNEDSPVENVSYIDALRFCNKLSCQHGLEEVYDIQGSKVYWKPNTRGYRLPIENEWEYALAYSKEELLSNLDDIAWLGRNSDRKTSAVGQLKANRYGLYDMIGNVTEWCFDSFRKSPYISGLYSGSHMKVLKGCNYTNFINPATIDSGIRSNKSQSTKESFNGFRILLEDYEQ